MALVNEHFLKLPGSYLFSDIAKKVNTFRITHPKQDTDFKNALDRHLDEEMNRLTTVKRIANSTIMVVIVLVVSGLIWLYSGVLDKVYNYEQTSKLSEQSEYYYQDFFGSRLLNDEEYDVSDIDKYYIEINTTQDETTDFMKRVHKYNLSHKGMNSL